MASSNRLVEWAEFVGDELPESLAERRDADFEAGFEDLFDAHGG